MQLLVSRTHFQPPPPPLPQSFDEMVELIRAGDVIGCEGFAGTSNTGSLPHTPPLFLVLHCLPPGQLVLVARHAQLLAPCLHTLPKPHFGLKEDVYALRNRHLDLLVNAPSRGFLSARAAVIRAVRSVLEGHDFMEMHTPVLQSVASGASARPFETHHAAYDSKVCARA